MASVMVRGKETASLGEKLKARREALGLNLDDIAHEIQAPKKYFEALEEDRYDVFSAKVYAAGFLKKFLSLLALEETQEEFLKEFATEWEVRMFRKRKEIVSLPVNKNGFLLTPFRLWFIGGAIGVGVVTILVVWQLIGFVGAPTLELDAPKDKTVVGEPSLQIIGRTDRENRLTVNGRELTIDESGAVYEAIELQPGLNVLEFIAENKFGKKSTLIRYIRVK